MTDLREEFIRDYIDGYEFRGDDYDYSPTDEERFLITDCVAGLLDELDRLQAARAQDDAKPVGIVRHRTDPRGDNPDAYVDWQFGGDEENMSEGTELYTRPPSAGVPEVLFDGFSVFQEVQRSRTMKGLKKIDDAVIVSDVLDAVVRLIKQESSGDE